MTQLYKLIVSFVHGNAKGVILEPGWARRFFDADQCPHTWIVQIGPLEPEAAVGAEFPEDDYIRVVTDLTRFCKKQGIYSCPQDVEPSSNKPAGAGEKATEG